jgi:hypothetical protein
MALRRNSCSSIAAAMSHRGNADTALLLRRNIILVFYNVGRISSLGTAGVNGSSLVSGCDDEGRANRARIAFTAQKMEEMIDDSRSGGQCDNSCSLLNRSHAMHSLLRSLADVEMGRHFFSLASPSFTLIDPSLGIPFGLQLNVEIYVIPT